MSRCQEWANRLIWGASHLRGRDGERAMSAENRYASICKNDSCVLRLLRTSLFRKHVQHSLGIATNIYQDRRARHHMVSRNHSVLDATLLQFEDIWLANYSNQRCIADNSNLWSDCRPSASKCALDFWNSATTPCNQSSPSHLPCEHFLLDATPQQFLDAWSSKAAVVFGSLAYYCGLQSTRCW